MRLHTDRRHTRRIAGVAAVAAAALILAGCGSTKDSSGAGESNLPGISADKVKIGYGMVDNGELSTTLGFVQPNYGDMNVQKKAVEAVIKYVNDNGGMGGRQVELVTNVYPALTDNPANALAQCNSFTQDQQVFAVVLDGALQPNAVPCYAQAKTLVLDQTLVAHDTGQFEKYAPYLWSVTHPEYGGFMKAQLTAMNEDKYFDGNSGVMIMASDDEVARRTTDTVVKPYLSSIGVTKTTIKYIDSTNTGTLGATISEALASAKSAKVNRIVAVGGARIVPVALSDVLAKTYTGKWTMATYDNPSFVERNPDQLNTASRIGMIGLGYAPATDVNQEEGPAFPDPNQPFQVKCHEIITAAGAAPPENLRVNWKNALQYCDGAMFLKAVLDNLPGKADVTGNDFKEAAGKIGSTYQSALTFGSSWGPGMYAGTNAAQRLRWDEDKNAFVYEGETITFGPVAAPATTPNGSSSVAPTDAAPTSAPADPATSAPAAPATSAPADPATSAPADAATSAPAASTPAGGTGGGTGGATDAWPSA